MSYSRKFLIQQFKKGIRKYMPIASAAETMINYKLSQLDEDDWARIENFFNSFTFPLHVYRGLNVKSEQDVNFKNPGNNWTVDSALFHAPFSAFRNSNYILEGYIDEDQIDWPETVQNFMYYSVNAANNQRYPENEVTLKKGQVPHDLTGSMKEALTEELNVPDKPSAKELLKDYVTTSFGLGSYYIDEDGTIYDLGNSGYGHAQASKLLNDNGLEVDYEPGKASKFLRSNGWIRINTNLNYIELPDKRLTSAQENSILLALDSMHNNFKFGDSIQITGKDTFKVYTNCTSDYLLNRIKRYYTTGKLYESKDLEEVYPQKNETKSDFINRFMRVTAKEYPNVKQRYAVANSYWDKHSKNEAYLDPEEKFWDYRTKEVQPGKYIDTSRSEIGWVDNLIHNIKYFEHNKGVTARIVDMTPEEYFEECANLFHNSVESQKKQIAADTETIEHLTDVIKKFGKRFPIPYINIANNSQEGRHRMYVLGELFGWDKAVPVLIIQDVNNVRVPGKELK